MFAVFTILLIYALFAALILLLVSAVLRLVPVEGLSERFDEHSLHVLGVLVLGGTVYAGILVALGPRYERETLFPDAAAKVSGGCGLPVPQDAEQARAIEIGWRYGFNTGQSRTFILEFSTGAAWLDALPSRLSPHGSAPGEDFRSLLDRTRFLVASVIVSESRRPPIPSRERVVFCGSRKRAGQRASLLACSEPQGGVRCILVFQTWRPMSYAGGPTAWRFASRPVPAPGAAEARPEQG
jgi:hypothetical protein